jgi:hypothetical protein
MFGKYQNGGTPKILIADGESKSRVYGSWRKFKLWRMLSEPQKEIILKLSNRQVKEMFGHSIIKRSMSSETLRMLKKSAGR